MLEAETIRLSVGLADLLGSQIVTNQALVALRRNPSGTYTLTFHVNDQFTDVTADHVVLALPFSILKNSVDLTQAAFSELKMIAIQELAMGSNSKLHGTCAIHKRDVKD